MTSICVKLTKPKYEPDVCECLTRCFINLIFTMLSAEAYECSNLPSASTYNQLSCPNRVTTGNSSLPVGGCPESVHTNSNYAAEGPQPVLTTVIPFCKGSQIASSGPLEC